MAQAGLEADAAQLSSLLSQLNGYTTNPARVAAPSPSEAMAIYSVAVRLVRLQLTASAHDAGEPADLSTTRDVLLSTRRLLRAALDRLERVTPAPLAALDGNPADV